MHVFVNTISRAQKDTRVPDECVMDTQLNDVNEIYFISD